MTDSALLKYFIEKRGYSQTEVAGLLGITAATFNNKVNNKREFTTTEMSELQELLNMSLKEKEDIFFKK